MKKLLLVTLFAAIIVRGIKNLFSFDLNIVPEDFGEWWYGQDGFEPLYEEPPPAFDFEAPCEVCGKLTGWIYVNEVAQGTCACVPCS